MDNVIIHKDYHMKDEEVKVPKTNHRTILSSNKKEDNIRKVTLSKSTNGSSRKKQP